MFETHVNTLSCQRLQFSPSSLATTKQVLSPAASQWLPPPLGSRRQTWQGSAQHGISRCGPKCQGGRLSLCSQAHPPSSAIPVIRERSVFLQFHLFACGGSAPLLVLLEC